MKKIIRYLSPLTILFLVLLLFFACNNSSGDSVVGNNDDLGEETSIEDSDSDLEEPVSSPFPGYNLFSSLKSTIVYLMDNDGKYVHSWEAGDRPGLSMYLLENGKLLHTSSAENDIFDAGGAGGLIQIIDWDGNIEWSYEYNTQNHLHHHDVEMLPNGNILMIAWEYKTRSEAVEAGRNPSLIRDGELWPDSIIEVKPLENGGGEIVWEWYIFDHLIQDYDNTKDNYGVVGDHPELIDINFLGNSGADWTHINSIDYNEELDQIVLSVHGFSEIWIIDHSTTTKEASGHSGGNSGRGGDLLYRWGNPQAYDAGTSSDQKLFVQHDAEWIEKGSPGYGNIIIFNNGGGRPQGDYSSVDEIVPPINVDGSYSLSQGSSYGPESAVWSYTAQNPTDFYAKNISGQKRLPNGNTLICDGPKAHFFEVNVLGEIVWEHNHFGDVFRVERYGTDYSGLAALVSDNESSDNETGNDDNNDDNNDNNDDNNSILSKNYKIVDTGQSSCYDNNAEISAPSSGDAFYGQDAQINGLLASYTKSSDGLTIYDNITGLTWTKTPDLNGDGEINSEDKLSFANAKSYPSTLNTNSYGGYNDWRLPTIKELYSLMNFSGTDPNPSGTNTSNLIPFIDTNYFDFAYGDTDGGDRIIDSQFWSSNEYVDYVFSNQSAAFGLNLADGRIKGYPTSGQVTKENFVYFVRGNKDYGINNYKDNGDNTITDNATGLMWSKDDSGSGMNWEDALSFAQTKNANSYLGYDDWRLPNAKEMQSIVDYSKAPSSTGTAAIDPIFNITQISNEAGDSDFPWFWTGTTHIRQGGAGASAVYICFGRATGYMKGSWLDVHGAGAQRSDQKGGDFSNFTYVYDGYYFGNSPQGDATRIYNFVRLVRDVD